MDLDDRIKAIKESWAFGSHPTLGILCRSCGAPILIYGYDQNGDPIHDARCGACTARLAENLRRNPPPSLPPAPRTHCNRCYDSPPLRGCAWCGSCALKCQAQRIADGEDPAVVEHTITAIKARIEAPPEPDGTEIEPELEEIGPV